MLYNWQVGQPAHVAVWACILEGANFNRGNLSIRRVSRRGSLKYQDSKHKNLRLHGRHTWHVLDRSPKRAVALFECPSPVLDREALSDDFVAMQFVFGGPCKMGFAVGLSQRGEVVAAMGLHFGFRPVKEGTGGDGPIVDRFDTVNRWIPVAFAALCKKMADDRASPLRVPLSGFLDAAGDHVDGAYMKIQVATEAFCHELPKPTGATTLVKDNAAWIKWVTAHKDEIEAHATDSEAARKLLGKARNALQFPSTDAVEDGLAFLQIALPLDLLDEVRGRNRSVHRFLMSSERPRNVAADGLRVEKVKAVLTALVMKYAAYDGPIAGWERDETGWKNSPAWWSVTANEDAARVAYLCDQSVDALPPRARRYERILALDGGGTWALIEVRALINLFEDEGGADVTGHRVLERFDLVVANSGGSIVAAALACDMPLGQIAALFEGESARRSIFRAKWPEAIGRRLPLPRYPTHGKYEGLRALLGSMVDQSVEAWHKKHPSLAHLLFIGFDYDTNRAAFFRSDTSSAAASSSSAAPSSATLLDAVHASTNAPVLYFDRPTNLPEGDGRRFWDGAIGGFNNPTLAGVVEAVANRASRSDIRVLSIGSGTVRRPRRPENVSVTDDRFTGGDPGGVLPDFKKLAGSILDDPPDTASFTAHVFLGGALPLDSEVVHSGPVVRMNPTIRPILSNGVWQWGPALSDVRRKLLALDMDAIAQSDVALIRHLCDAWLNDEVPNQPIRAGSALSAEIGHDTYAEAADAARRRVLTR